MYILPLEGVRGEEPSLGEGLGGLLKHRHKLCRYRCLKLHWLTRYWVMEAEHIGMKAETVKRIITITILDVTTNRMPHI